jgi:hypothetical protein
MQQLQTECCRDGAWVENKGVLLTYHYRTVPPDLREPLVLRARELISAAGFRIGNAHCALESKPPVAWDKGRASIYILRTAFGVDWSDRSDTGGFEILAIYAPMIYTAPCIMFWMRACISIKRTSGRGLGPGNREFLGPCEMASRADRRVPFGAQKSRTKIAKAWL